MAETYDAIIVGTGQAGPSLAAALAGSGMRVAIAERHRFGGTCVKRRMHSYQDARGERLRGARCTAGGRFRCSH